MDIKLVIKALQLGDEEWEEHLDLINRLRLLTDTEQSQLFSALEPQKKSSKKAAGGGGRKSTRAASLQQQISGHGQSLIQPPSAATTDDTDDSTHTRCQFTRADGKLCLLLPDHNIHHLQTAMDYHEFVAGKSDAQSAAGGS